MSVQKDVSDTFNAAADTAEQSARIMGKSAEAAADKAAAKTVRIGRAGIETSKTAVAKMDAGARQWMDWAMQSYQANLSAFQAMAGSRSAQQVLAIQNQLMRDQMNLLMDTTSRVRSNMLTPA